MFTTPKKPGGAYTPYTPHSNSPSKVRLNGLFTNGVWHCNCNPRLPASHFQVKKDGPTEGRWFYTCQEPKPSACGFFLWDDKAEGREMQAVISNTRSEPDAMRTPADAGRDRMTVEGHKSASKKFLAAIAKANEDEFGDWSLIAEDEQKLVCAVQEADAAEYPETPRKAVKTSEFATPGSKRKREDEILPTPVSGAMKSHMRDKVLRRDEDVLNTPSSRPKGGLFDGNERFGLRSPSVTPNPGRFQDNTSRDDVTLQRVPTNYDITDEVLDILKDQHIDKETTSKLRALLNKHTLQVAGISKGRDITRLALKGKDAKITELQQKITSLEAAREMDKTVIRHFKANMSHSVEKRRDRGRGKS